MTDHVPQTASADDAWLDELLRADAHEHDADYLADDGFTARVMSDLPAPATLPAWRKPAIAALWATAGIGVVAALPGTLLDGANALASLLATHRFSLTDVGIVILALAGMSWAGTVYTLQKD
jgi:hypothetical protein